MIGVFRGCPKNAKFDEGSMISFLSCSKSSSQTLVDGVLQGFHAEFAAGLRLLQTSGESQRNLCSLGLTRRWVVAVEGRTCVLGG